jgi:hypothetical protein
LTPTATCPGSTSAYIKRNAAASFSPPPNFRRARKPSSLVSPRNQQPAMGGGNAQKSKMAREKNLEKLKGGKGNAA